MSRAYLKLRHYEKSEIEDAQSNLCAICEGPETVKHWYSGTEYYVRRLCEDHDHGTGTFRALLCAACNKGLGFFRDKPALLEAAARYLRHHAAKRAG